MADLNEYDKKYIWNLDSQFSWQLAMGRKCDRVHVYGAILSPCPCRCHTGDQIEHEEACCKVIAEEQNNVAIRERNSLVKRELKRDHGVDG